MDTLTNARVGVLLNTASGSCTREAEGELEQIMEEQGITAAHVWRGHGRQIRAMLKEIARTDLDVLIVLGGDGTIRSAAMVCASDRPLLIPLPGGTMNMLPKALYGEGSWQDALRDTLRNPKAKEVSAGKVCGEEFYIAAIIGTPARFARARELWREGSYAAAAKSALRIISSVFTEQVTYQFGGEEPGRARSVVALCPLTSKRLHEAEQVLEAATIDVAHMGEVLALTTAAALGDWRDDSNVSIHHTRRFQVRARSAIPVILDGESLPCGKSLEVEFIPHALTALVPA